MTGAPIRSGGAPDVFRSFWHQPADRAKTPLPPQSCAWYDLVCSHTTQELSPMPSMKMRAAALTGLLFAIGSFVAVASPAGAQGVTCNGKTVTITTEPGVPTNGTDGDDVIIGSPADDVINGRLGNDTICGLGGKDEIRGAAGADWINGGGGGDKIWGGDGHDILQGGDGWDRMFGGSGKDNMDGGGGNDFMRGNGWADTMLGSAGNDDVHGGLANDILFGGPGDDYLRGSNGTNTCADPDEDTQYGGCQIRNFDE